MNTPVREFAPPDVEARRDPGSWRAASVCRQHPTDWWFSGGHRETLLAKSICAGCIVRPQCLEFALGRPELLGVWAATTPNERASMRRSLDGVTAGPATPPTVAPVTIDLVAEISAEAPVTPLALAESEPTWARGPEPEHAGSGRRGFGDRPELLTPAEAARLLGVTPNTVTRWSRAGKVSAIQTMGGHRRFRRSEIERVLQESNVPASMSN